MATKIRAQVIIHMGGRVVSGLLSFYLFSLISKLHEPEQVRHIYFFLFIFGFSAAALRTLGNVSASLDPDRSRTANLRRLKIAIGEVIISCVVVIPGTIWLLSMHVKDRWILAAAAVTLGLAAIDVDMLRGLMRRNNRFAATFALGSGLAVCIVLIQTKPSVETAISALLLQWVPVCASNVQIIARVVRRSIGLAYGRLMQDGSMLLALCAVALFDGLVLNIPFLMGNKFPLATSLEIAVVMRIFSASLVFFPLILHWSNSNQLRKISDRFSVKPINAYLSLQLVASTLSGSAFGFAFWLVAKQPITVWQLLSFVVLTLSYCGYATLARFNAGNRASSALALALAGVASVLWAATLVFLNYPGVESLTFAILQSAALLFGALIIRYIAPVVSSSQ